MKINKKIAFLAIILCHPFNTASAGNELSSALMSITAETIGNTATDDSIGVAVKDSVISTAISTASKTIVEAISNTMIKKAL